MDDDIPVSLFAKIKFILLVIIFIGSSILFTIELMHILNQTNFVISIIICHIIETIFLFIIFIVWGFK
jgi:hypothetical protein